jgi:hypothetical protein
MSHQQYTTVKPAIPLKPFKGTLKNSKQLNYIKQHFKQKCEVVLGNKTLSIGKSTTELVKQQAEFLKVISIILTLFL